MTTIFTILTDILQKKKGDLHTDSEFINTLKSNYIFQRWVSMSKPMNAYLINETTNKIAQGLGNDLELWYKLFIVLIDKNPTYQKINYIKKKTVTENDDLQKLIQILQTNNNLSEREVKQYLELEEQLNINNIERYKKYIN
jgi:hypothetical protein